MATPTSPAHPYGFDDKNVEWRGFGGLEGLEASVLHVDLKNHLVEFLIKFAHNAKAIPHCHLAPVFTFVIEGDHVIYETDGSVREVRPVGRFTASGVDGDVHDEGGGPDGCTLLYSVRGDGAALFDMMDADLNVVATIGTADYQAAWDAQRGA